MHICIYTCIHRALISFVPPQGATRVAGSPSEHSCLIAFFPIWRAFPYQIIIKPGTIRGITAAGCRVGANNHVDECSVHMCIYIYIHTYGALGNNCAQQQLRSETLYHKNTTGQLTKQVTIAFEKGSARAIVSECTVYIYIYICLHI